MPRPSILGVGLSRGRESWCHHGSEDSSQSQRGTERGLGRGRVQKRSACTKSLALQVRCKHLGKRGFVVPKARVKKKEGACERDFWGRCRAG